MPHLIGSGRYLSSLDWDSTLCSWRHWSSPPEVWVNSGLCSLKLGCTQLPDRPIHQCHNLLLSSLCSLIKTQFEVITCPHKGITPPCGHSDLSARHSLCVFSPFVSTSLFLSPPFLFHSACPLFFSVCHIQWLKSYNLHYYIHYLGSFHSTSFRPLKTDKILTQSR